MPSATRNGPITSAQSDNPTTDPEPNATETGGYNTRKKSYRYSHTKAPYVPPPPRPPKRQPPPVSVACKRQRVDAGSTAEDGNTNTGADTNRDLEAHARENIMESGSTSAAANPISSLLGSSDLQANVNSHMSSSSTLQQTFGDSYDPVPSNALNSGGRAPEPEPCETVPPSRISTSQSEETEPQQLIVRLQQTSSNSSHMGTYASNRQGIIASTARKIGASASTLHFTTPQRPTQTFFVIQTPPAWARFDAEIESEFPTFAPRFAASFTQPSARIEDIDTNTPLPKCPFPSSNHSSSGSHQDPPVDSFVSAGGTGDFDSFSEPQTGHPDPDSQSNAHNSETTAPADVPMGSTAQTQSTALVVRTPTSNFSQMHNAVRQTLPSAPPLAHRNSDSSMSTMVQTSHTGGSPASYVGLVAGSEITSHSRSVSGAHSHTGLISRASSLALGDGSSHGGSTSRDSPAPVVLAGRSQVQTSRSNSNAHHRAQRLLRQRDFTYMQVVFMNAMTKRWNWYLIADDLFPVNTNLALELCMQYAEQDLDLSRKECDIGRPAMDFVRRKDSSIRSLFQMGLLSILETGYGVNNGTIDKLNELISQSNYIYAEYDTETKKVSGRYRHPCLMHVLAAILFAKRKRGRPIGVRFMPDIMGGNYSTGAPEQPGGNGITVSMIALTCTLVLYGLQSIRAGDSSQRLGTRKGKPVHFTERKYSAHYRNFINKIQEYNRLEEVRKAYLEEVMREYLQIRVDEIVDSDEDLEVDDEMHSDGD